MTDPSNPDAQFAEFYNLWSAATADALHQILILYQPVKATADSFEPLMLLQKHHETEPEATPDTAVLLVTDRRWRNGVGRLIRRIAESGMIDSDSLDEMAEMFLAAGKHLYLEVPEEWFGGEVVVLDSRLPTPDDDPEAEDEGGDEGDGPAVAARTMYPPLRRWAASRLVARDPQVWAELFVTARDLGGADGAAMMRGLLDGLDHLPAEVRPPLIDAGADWPQTGVRKQALLLLADAGDRQTAHDRALKDRSAAIRKWAPRLLETTTMPEGESTVADRDAAGVARARKRTGQESLF